MHTKYIYSVASIMVILIAGMGISFLNTTENFKKYYVDFDVSMQAQSYPQRFVSPAEKQFYTTFKKSYEKNNPRSVAARTTHTIPKIIHQIWLGSEFPPKYQAFQNSWKKYHPDWEYRLWTEKELATFPMKHRALFDASINYGEKSDIARYEILYQMGGLYVDTDFECLKAFDILHNCYDFYIGIQPLDTNIVQLGIGLIGSTIAHPLLQCCLGNLAKNAAQTRQIIQRTGPLYFTQIFEIMAPLLLLYDATVALPSTFFYPRGYTQSAERNLWQKPESFAVHHWEGSWMEQEAFVPNTQETL